MQLPFLRSQAEVGNAKSFYFGVPEGVTWKAGQYQGYTIPAAGPTEKENQRWFTVSAAPSEGEFRITTRLTDSDFKRNLDYMGPGEFIDAHDLGGDFTWEDDAPVVMVAGGIGVTPFRSMLRERANTGRPLDATLIYANRDEDVIFREELDDLSGEHQEFKVIYLIGEQLSAERILEVAPEAKEMRTYLSGPEPMVEAVGEALKKVGVTDLKQDWFPGYDEKTA